MIQRIQSVYLLLVTGLLIAGMVGIRDMGTGFHSTWGLSVILLVCTLIAFITIFLYKRRILQTKMILFNNILLVGYYIDIITFYFMTKGNPETSSFQLSWTLCFPVIAMIINYLARRAIKRDEAMVKATDRLR
ncbi:hypothetical protein EZS27_028037 [termite gut metagenome]|uniref:DUF4293 family protein n=1 Tax=termite gut metagenome TaxID=433724 RepID=A0A5J4QMK3_9ZZZZ